MIIIETQHPTFDPLIEWNYNDLVLWDEDEIFVTEEHLSIHNGFTVVEDEKFVGYAEFYHCNIDNENRTLQQLNKILEESPVLYY